MSPPLIKRNTYPYFIGKFMSKLWFNVITHELRFTNTNPQPYVDKFWQIIKIIKAWNYHMISTIFASLKICLDKSMSIWHRIWTCLGWIFFPQKPYQFGNYWYTSCCSLSGILFVVELVEGKSNPRQDGTLEF